MARKDEAQAHGLGDTTLTTTTDNHHEADGYPQSSAADRQCAAVAGVRRRRAASRRLPVLEHSRVADPWTPWRPDVLSDPQADGVVAAAEHLAIAGLAPLFDATTLRQMWRRGGDDRALAEELHRLTDGVIA